MRKIVKHCDICEGFITQRWEVTRILKKRKRRRHRHNFAYAPSGTPYGVYICGKCRKLPNVTKFLKNMKRRYEKLKKEQDAMWDKQHKFDDDFIEMVEAFRRDRPDD